GSRHQRFIVRLRGGMTVLILHNIDLVDRVPLAEGDRVRVRGEYEWNAHGGSVHWTHEDPRGWHDAGFVIHHGVLYGLLNHRGGRPIDRRPRRD
ncbi:MAG: DUF3465 domain-containing protein, partial [Phycisphaerales bacterium]|nr:DUF3465 domain-containing protein [Phycisphaerales bacterium]